MYMYVVWTPPLQRSQFSFTPSFTIFGFQELPPLSQSFHWPSRRWVWIFSRTALWLITGHKKSTHINGHIFIASLFKAILSHAICHLKNQLFTKNVSVWYTFVFNYCLKTFLIVYMYLWWCIWLRFKKWHAILFYIWGDFWFHNASQHKTCTITLYMFTCMVTVKQIWIWKPVHKPIPKGPPLSSVEIIYNFINQLPRVDLKHFKLLLSSFSSFLQLQHYNNIDN